MLTLTDKHTQTQPSYEIHYTRTFLVFIKNLEHLKNLKNSTSTKLEMNRENVQITPSIAIHLPIPTLSSEYCWVVYFTTIKELASSVIFTH